MRSRFPAIAAAAAFMLLQGPGLAATPPAKDQQDFCALVEQARAAAATPDPAARQRALAASRAETEAFIEQHRGIDWVGPLGRIIVSQTGKAAGEVEACPSVWVGGLSPEGGLDSDTWAEPETRLFNRWQEMKPGRPVGFRAALLGVYDKNSEFPAKIWMRARIVDVSPLP
jgi:hypothetical protein